MTSPSVKRYTQEPVEKFNPVQLSISNKTLRDLVEISLRLEGIPMVEGTPDHASLLIADLPSLDDPELMTAIPIAQHRTLLIVTDEVEIPEGIEYLVVPKSGSDFDLDPELLVRKVRGLLSGGRTAADINPVTGLPGAAAFESELRDRINTGERFGVVFSDLNQFKSYNKAYSYTRGDQMLMAVGELMSLLLNRKPHPQNFIAHLGSDDFALITSEKIAQELAEEIVDSFDEMISSFYDFTDLSRGSVIISDRKGRESECPIVTISLAVILSSRRALSHAAEALEIAEDLLALLKSREVTESCCIVERKESR